MQKWEFHIRIEITVLQQKEKQKQLLGIAENRAQGWKHYYTTTVIPSTREQKKRQKQAASSHCLQLREPQRNETLQKTRVFWELAALLSHHQSVLETGCQQGGPPTQPGCSYQFSSPAFIPTQSLRNYIAILNEDNRRLIQANIHWKK